MKKIAITGTTTIKQILDSLGKLDDSIKFKSFKLEISEMIQLETTCKEAATATKEEKESALAMLTPAEQATLAKLSKRVSDAAKAMAEKRVAGQTNTRHTIKASCSYLGCK